MDPTHPAISDVFKWRIKPEPRIKWEIRGTSAGGMKWSSSTFSEEKAAEWKAKGWIVTEWQEVVK